MLKKEEIFVNIQSESEYNKVIKLLRSFGQRLEMIGWKHIRCAQFYEDSWCARFYGDRWCAIQRSYIERLKTEVSIQELKNILAFEYLKKGDVIIFSGGTSGVLWIAEFERFIPNRWIDLPIAIKTKRHNSLYKESRYQHSASGEIHGSFVRFATDGEKRVLGVDTKLDADSGIRHAIYINSDGHSELQESKEDFYRIPDYRNFPNEVQINEEWPIKTQVSKKDQLIELLNDAYKSISNVYTLDTMPVRSALFNAMDYITSIPDITTHDIAKIERLHDYLIDAHNIHPSLKQLAEAREVISKLSKYE